MVAAIGRAIEPAAGAVRWWVNAPRRTARLPERGVECRRILRIECQIDRAGVFVVEEDFLPGFSAVSRAKDAALPVWAVRMAERRDVNDVRVMRIHKNASNLP